MPAPPPLPAALRRHAAADPEEPWLFRAEGWDWVWHSWGELAGWMEPWTERLSSLPAGSRAAFLYLSRPESVILDLAIQAAGLVSVPASARRDEAFWIEMEEGELRITPSASPSPPPPEEDWAAAGERLRGEIRGPQGRREIVVLGGPLEDPGERTMLAWATLAGAAVVLEPDPALRAATAAWVRPTVFHGSPEQIAQLRARVEKERGRRLPFGRLHTVIASREIAEEAAFWQGRGVRVAQIPGFAVRGGS